MQSFEPELQNKLLRPGEVVWVPELPLPRKMDSSPGFVIVVRVPTKLGRKLKYLEADSYDIIKNDNQYTISAKWFVYTKLNTQIARLLYF